MIADILTGAFIVTMLSVFVRPNSKGSSLISAATAAMVAVISQVTDIADGTDTEPAPGEDAYDEFNQQYDNTDQGN